MIDQGIFNPKDWDFLGSWSIFEWLDHAKVKGLGQYESPLYQGGTE